MAVHAALLDRAGELKRELVAFSQQPRYDRAFSEVLAQHGSGSEVLVASRWWWKSRTGVGSQQS
jgi:hypothetical protein